MVSHKQCFEWIRRSKSAISQSQSVIQYSTAMKSIHSLQRARTAQGKSVRSWTRGDTWTIYCFSGSNIQVEIEGWREGWIRTRSILGTHVTELLRITCGEGTRCLQYSNYLLREWHGAYRQHDSFHHHTHNCLAFLHSYSAHTRPQQDVLV